MTYEEILLQARVHLDDAGAPGVLWTDEQLISYLNNGMTEACRRGLLIKDSSSAICQVAVDAGTKDIDLDPVILFVDRAHYSYTVGQVTSNNRVRRIDMSGLDSILGWETLEGTPRYFSTDWEDRKILLVPTPIRDGYLHLTMYRDVAEQATLDNLSTTEPEFDPTYHSSLVWWIGYEAYRKHDAETEAGTLAAADYAAFERVFGSARPAPEFEAARRKYPKKFLDSYNKSPEGLGRANA